MLFIMVLASMLICSQTDALLPNVRPKPSRVPPLERFLFVLHSFIMSIPSTPPQHPLEGARELLKKGVAVPYSLPLPTDETNWKVAFDPPSDIILAGSWANKVSVKPKDDQKLGVDLAVEMPDVRLVLFFFCSCLQRSRHYDRVCSKKRTTSTVVFFTSVPSILPLLPQQFKIQSQNLM